jgi:phosphatidylglycerol lysyltransferase
MTEAKVTPLPKKAKATRHWITLAIALGAAGLTGYIFYDLRENLKSDQLAQAIHSIPSHKLVLSALATALSFIVMGFMEWLGARHYVKPDISLRRAGFFAFIIYGISNTFGFAGLASTPLRLRMYGDDAKTDRILSLCLLASAAFWIGLGMMLGASLLVAAVLRASLPLSSFWLWFGGATFLGTSLAACWFLAGRGTKAIGNLELSFPGRKQLFTQSSLAALDWLFAGLALYWLLPDAFAGRFFHFMSGFLLSQVASLVSSIPGGIGVLEGFNLYLLSAPKESLPELAAAFIAYRSIYYLPPLLGSFALFLIWNIKRATNTFAYAAEAFVTYGRSGVPVLASLFTGLIGFGLLINSGQVFDWIVDWSVLPPFWESLLGTALLILAVGLYERSSSACKMTIALMVPLALGALINGPVWTGFIIAVALAAALYFNTREFYRRSELSSLRNQQRISTIVLLPVLASMVLAIVAYYRHELDSQQWWRFTFDSTAPGFLRSCVGSLVTLGAYGFWALLSPRRRPTALSQSQQSTPEQELALAAIDKSPFTTACLALVGDKDYFHATGIEGFVMYKIARPYWIVMGDPVCAPHDSKKLMSAFLDECDKLGGTPVFYQTRPETLSRYVEIGFQAVKIGEEARVLLPQFSLEGRERKSMRNTCSRFEREGYKFAILSREAVPARISDLREVSDDWLKTLSMREKAFSMGYFNENYLSQNDVAVITKDDRVVAFANLWVTGLREELSVDLMRYSSSAPSGAMEYLIIQLMLHAKSGGYNWFNLGMAPLAGLEGIHSGRQWHRVGSMIYRAGEAFYNFRGLKTFKDKFGPHWESRFLVYPPGSNLARILSSVAVLINFKGVKLSGQLAPIPGPGHKKVS